MINWEVVTWTCITLAVLLVLIGLVLTIMSAVNMGKRRKQMAEIHTTLGVGSKVMFAISSPAMETAEYKPSTTSSGKNVPSSFSYLPKVTYIGTK